MALPVTVPALSIEIKALYLSDTEPTPSEGYEICQVKNLEFTILWMEYKVITA